jgi:heat shock protein 1/8
MASGSVGIDIGTHASCVAIFKNEKPDVIANENGNRTTPSVVAYMQTGEIIAGDEANNQMARNTANTIYDTKKILGKKFSQDDVQDEIKTLPFQMRAKSGDQPVYVVNHEGKEKEVTSEEITAHIIAKMKAIAETGTGKKVTKAVFAVPPWFTNDQRTALKNSALRQGVTPQRIISEPIAVVIAYLNQEDQKEYKKITQNILVFDLGGGGLNVAVVCVHHDLMELKAFKHEPKLGGEGFDEVLIKHFEADFKRKFRGADLSTNKRAVARLRVASERVKMNLSTMQQAAVELDGLYEGMDFNSNITRARFEDLAYDLTKGCVAPIAKCLEEAKMEKKDIHKVLMVGGGSRIPAVQTVVSQFFDGKGLVKFTNPEECVAMGACIESEILEGNLANPKTDYPHVVHAAPYSLGIETFDGQMAVLIHKNSILPIRKAIEFSTSEDNQQAVFLQVYEGEDPIAKNNNLLGKIAIKGIEPAPKGTPQIKVNFTLNVDGILEIVAEEKSSGNSQKLSIQQ